MKAKANVDTFGILGEFYSWPLGLNGRRLDTRRAPLFFLSVVVVAGLLGVCFSTKGIVVTRGLLEYSAFAVVVMLVDEVGNRHEKFDLGMRVSASRKSDKNEAIDRLSSF